MLETIFNLTGFDINSFNLNDDVLFTATCLILLFCLGYVFNFFQTLMERLTAKKGRQFMEVIVQAGEFMANSFIVLWNAIGTWGVIGVGIVAPFVLRKIGELIKRIFQF